MTVYVVGVDGSQTAEKAAQRAGQLAKATGGSLHVVSAFTRDGALTGADGARHTSSSLSVAEQIAEAQAAAYRADGLTATAAAGEGKAADVILEEARQVGADVIVVGNKRMQGVARVLGAVANDIVHHAPCDVLLVKTV